MSFLSVEFLVGRVVIVSGFFMLLPVILSLLFFESEVYSLIVSSLITVLIGYSMTLHGKSEGGLTNREAILTVVGSWLMVSLCGSLPFMFTGVLSPFYSILESISGFTTVGESLIPDLDVIPKALLLWRNITQWLGGMGVIVLFVSFLPHYGTGASNLFNAELPGPSKEKVLPRISDGASLLWLIYAGMTVFFIILMYLCGLNAFESIAHGFATISLGGFPIYNDSILRYNSKIVEMLTNIFNILAAGSFYIYYLVYIRGIKRVFKDAEFRTYLLVIAVFSILISLSLFFQGGHDIFYSVYYGFFQTTQAVTTSGYAITDISAWPPFCNAILFIALFIGGCSGSASGGLKISRLIVLLQLGWNELNRILHPKVFVRTTMGEKDVSPTVSTAIARYFFLYVAVYFISTILLTLSGVDLYSSLLIMISMLCTAGTCIPMSMLNNGLTYSAISDFGKIVMTVCMFLGRLELFTILVLLRPEFWRKTRNW